MDLLKGATKLVTTSGRRKVFLDIETLSLVGTPLQLLAY